MKRLLFISIFFCFASSNLFAAANLIEVYQQALVSDQLFQQAIAQRLSDKQGVPISLSALLPAGNILGQPFVSKTNVSGSLSNFVGTNTQRGYTLSLTLTQTVFNFAQFSNLCAARALSKSADATLNAATQELMLRVAKAYFAILNDEDILNYTISAKKAYAEQLDQVTQEYKVGLKTITDVYTAKASYSNSEADYIAAVNTLQNDRENLRVITGIYYSSLAKLSEKIPYVMPQPANIEEWVTTAQMQNWTIKAAQYNSESARQTIKQEFAGHLPNAYVQGTYTNNFNRVVSANVLGTAVEPPSPTPVPDPTPLPINESVFPTGTTRLRTAAANLTVNIPLFQGGYVVATTRKAQYDYKVALSKLEQQIRNTINNTRQSYLGILNGISKIKADKQTIQSAISSLEGMRAAYQVGTETLVDVLTLQQKLYQAQKQYATDRYAYVNNYLALKFAAGTLSVDDLAAINSWLLNSECK